MGAGIAARVAVGDSRLQGKEVPSGIRGIALDSQTAMVRAERQSAAYVLGPVISRFEVRTAHPPGEKDKLLLLKSHSSFDLRVIDSLLKEALVLIRGRYSRCCRLRDVLVEQKTPEEAPTLSYVLECESALDYDTIKRDDTLSANPSGLKEYELSELKEYELSGLGASEGVRLFDATNSRFPQPLLVRKYSRKSFAELSPFIRSAVQQARLSHKRICPLLDVAFTKTGRKLEFSIVTEKLPRNLSQIVRNGGASYSESNYIRLIEEIGSALAYAKTLNIAHGQLLPMNVFVNRAGEFVLGGFCGVLENRRREAASSVFPEDVRCLALLVLFVGGHEPEAVSTFVCSDVLKSLLVTMTQPDPQLRPQVEVVLQTITKITSMTTGLYRVMSESVCLYNLEEGRWMKPLGLSSAIAVDDRSSYVLFDEDELFCCGNAQASGREAYMLHLHSNLVKVEELAPMSQAHRAPGLLYYEMSIFVFGSRCECQAGGPAEKSAEVLTSRRWEALAQQMSCERCYFTPCSFERRGYLFSSYAPACIDVLDLDSRVFLEPKVVELPNEGGGNVCAIEKGQLTIISRARTVTLNLRTGNKQEVEHEEKKDINPSSISFVWSDSIYWVRTDGKCIRACGARLTEIQE